LGGRKKMFSVHKIKWTRVLQIGKTQKEDEQRERLRNAASDERKERR